jgi:hypothetical protein
MITRSHAGGCVVVLGSLVVECVRAVDTTSSTCLTTGGLAGVIFGCIFATLFAAIGIATLVYFLCRSKKGRRV